jgi:hypothetical protein
MRGMSRWWWVALLASGVGCDAAAPAPEIEAGVARDQGPAADGGLLDAAPADAAADQGAAAEEMGVEADGGADAPCVLEPGRRSLRRLSHVELSNTLRDVLGVDAPAFGALVPDPVVHGFANNGVALEVGPLLADQYRLRAEAIGSAVALAPIMPCATQDRACAITLVQTLGARLFRRPLTGEEAGRYLAIYDLAAPDGFEPAVRWVLAGLLQSPHFLYRTELGRRTDTGFVLTPYEIATELSYLFWQTSPDDDLWALAESGALLDPAVQAAQAQRLLADPRSAETMARFTERWLDLTRLASVSRDAELYGALTPALRADMAEQTHRSVTEAWTSGASLADLLSADQVWVNGALAAHYGLPAPAEGTWAQVSAAGSPYGGVLAEGSVLTAHAKPISSSPIHRGKLVRERLLCQDLPPPPAGLDTSPPDVDPARSTRDRYAEHAGNPACSSCHRLMDPIGFGFEHFDGIGRYRELDGVHPVDARGFLLDAGPGITNFDGLAGLQDALAGNVMVDGCYTVQWIRFGLGTDEADHALDVACYAERLTPGISTLRGVLPALVGTPHFTRRVGTAEEADVPGADLVPTEPGAVVEPPPDPVEPDPVEPDPVGPGETAGAMLSLVEASRWGTGYCSNATVLNTTDAPLVWAVAAQVEGHINNLWNAEGSADSGRVVFHGVAWNAELAPGQVAAFGFCADL